MAHQSEPKNYEDVPDKYNSCLILFYFLGMLTLLPVNFLTTAQGYWNYKFRDPSLPYNSSSNNTTHLQVEFTSYVSIVAHVTTIVGLMVTTIVSRRIAIGLRLFISLIVIFLIFLFTTLLAVLNTDSWQGLFFGLTIFSIFLISAFGSCYMMTVFQLSAKFPQIYLAANLTGQTICGIFAALIEILTLAAGAKDKENGLYYFSIGSVCVLCPTIYYSIVQKSPYFRYHTDKESEMVQGFSKKMFLDVLKRQKFYLLSVVLVVGSSTSIQPSVTSKISSVHKGCGNEWNDIYFETVVTFLIYNLSDLVGREIATKLKWPTNDKTIFLFALGRLIIIPLILMCNVSTRKNTNTVFDSDWAYIIFEILFGFTNGCISNVAILNIPRKAKEGEKLFIGILILLSVLLGIGAFSFVGLIVIQNI